MDSCEDTDASDTTCVLDKENGPITRVPCDIHGKHSFDVGGQVFCISTRYQLLAVVGFGAYGTVVSAIDKETKQRVAVKKVACLFDDLVDAKRVLREIRLMRFLQHPNILSIIDIEDPNEDDFNEIYIITPLYDKDLDKILQSGIEVSDEQIRYIVYQLLCALKYVHSASILHRDLKPANCLIQDSCDVAICDFGLARYVNPGDAGRNEMTEYVITRWYRPPELVLSHDYNSSVDIWALGCVLAQLVGRKPLFPGRDYKHQVEVICSILGKPSMDQMQHICSENARSFLANLPDCQSKDFRTLYPDAHDDCIDLLRKMIRFTPSERISAADALSHSYFADYRASELEYDAEGEMKEFHLEPSRVDGQDLTRDDLSELILEEIRQFRPDSPIFERTESL